jgi:S-adenosylmethionine/arginine decarboxylase-like enzyme
MAVLKQSTTYTRAFKLISSTDHISSKTGASPTVNLSKAGAAFGAAGGTVTEIANGWYKVALNTTDTNTLGDLAFYITATGADDTDFCDQVTANILGDTLPANVTQWNSAAVATPNVSGVPKVDVVDWLGSAPNALVSGKVDSLANVDNGTAQAGAAGTITLRSGASATDSIYNDCDVCILSGTGAGQTRLITAYVGSTKVATIAPNWQTNPDNTSVYSVRADSRKDIATWLGTAVTAATAGIPDTNAKNINNVATTSVTTVNANIGQTQPLNFTGTGASALVKVDVIDWVSGAVPAVNVTGVPKVDVVDWLGSAPNSLNNGRVDSCPSIRSNTIATGAANGANLDASASATNDFYKSCLLFLTSGTGVGQVRLITAYSGSTKFATVTPNWATNPDNTTQFTIVPTGSVDLGAVRGTLSAGSAGYVGIDWSAVTATSTAVNLSNTTISGVNSTVQANVAYWLGSAPPAPNVAGVPLIDINYVLGTVATAATAGILDTNAKRINNVATTSVTTVNANIGTTQPINFTGTGASALVKSDMVDVAGAAVSTTSAQIGVNAVNIGGTAQTGRDLGASVLLSAGTGTGQLDFTSGVVKANATQWLGGTIPAVNVTGVPKVDVVDWLGTTVTAATAGIPDTNAKNINNVATTSVTTVNANVGQTQPVNFTGTGASAYVKVDLAAVNADTTAPANIANTYNGTGYVATTAPAQQQQVANIAVTGAALNTIASSLTLATGTDAGGVANTNTFDGVFDSWTDTAGTIDGYYEFDISGTTGATSVGVTWDGYLVGVVNTLKVYAYNWGGAVWDQIGTVVGISGTVVGSQEFELTSAHTGTGGNAGKVRIRFQAAGLVAATLKTDRILLGYAVVLTPPANWSSLSIDGSGRVDIGKVLGTASAGSAGYVGIDWAQVTNKTSTVGLTNTTISTTQQIASVSGAVGSVTGAVGSVTGNVGGNVVGSVASVVGAIGSVTGNVGGNVVGSVGSVVAAVTTGTLSAGTITTASFAAGAITSTVFAQSAADQVWKSSLSF